MDDSDEEQEIPILNETHPLDLISTEEEENIKKTLEFIEARMKFLDEKIKILTMASKKLVTLLAEENMNENVPDNINNNTNNPSIIIENVQE